MDSSSQIEIIELGPVDTKELNSGETVRVPVSQLRVSSKLAQPNWQILRIKLSSGCSFRSQAAAFTAFSKSGSLLRGTSMLGKRSEIRPRNTGRSSEIIYEGNYHLESFSSFVDNSINP